MQLYYMHHREMLQLTSTLFQIVTKRDPGGSHKSCHVIEAQWVAVRNGVIEQVESRKRQLALAAAPIDRAESLAGAKCHPVAIGPSRFVAMIDISDSMRGTPMHVAIAMGILTSELAHGPFHDKVISDSMRGTPMHVAIAMGILTSELAHGPFHDKVMLFGEEPSWIDLSRCDRLMGKINIIIQHDSGWSTDFYRAMKLICAVVRENNLGAHEIPDLLVISEMQFNDAQNSQRSSTPTFPKFGKPAVRTSGKCSAT
jgi:uncharacterized membrane protein (DUF441 family)